MQLTTEIKRNKHSNDNIKGKNLGGGGGGGHPLPTHLKGKHWIRDHRMAHKDISASAGDVGGLQAYHIGSINTRLFRASAIHAGGSRTHTQKICTVLCAANQHLRCCPHPLWPDHSTIASYGTVYMHHLP